MLETGSVSYLSGRIVLVMTGIRELREDRGLSAAGLARLMGVTERSIQRWEAGTSRPTKASARRLARALRVSVDELQLEPKEQPQPAEEKPPVAVAIIVRDGRTLVVRRRFSEGELRWTFVSGELEPGESAEQAAVRETAEEVGLQVRAESVLGDRVHPITKRAMTYVLCAEASGKLEHRDHEELSEVAWVDYEDLLARIPREQIYGPVLGYLSYELTGAPA